MINSRAKGRSSERDVELLMQAAGFDTERALSGRSQVHGDLISEGFAFEVRNREKLSIVRWSAEHEETCPPSLVPVLAYRCNRQPWRASMLIADWLDLVKEARA